MTDKNRQIRIKFGNKVWVFTKPLEFGEGTVTEDLWNKGYRVGLRKIFCIKFLEFTK